MNIITLTLYPAIDVHKRVGTDGTSEICGTDCAGKGVNVSRALLAAGAESTAYVTVGMHGGRRYLGALRRDGLSTAHDTVRGSIRRNVHIHSPEGDYVISGEGACAKKRTVSRILRRFRGCVGRGTYIVLSGAVPDAGVRSVTAAMLHRFSELGARIVLDSRSFSAGEIAALRPYLIKPNEDELCALLGLDTLRTSGNDGKTGAGGVNEAKVIEALEYLARYSAEHVLLTLGGSGAYYIDSQGEIYRADIPTAGVRSSSGAGDASVAGWLYGIGQGLSSEGLLREAMVFAVASCMTDGTEPPRLIDIQSLRPRISISRLK